MGQKLVSRAEFARMAGVAAPTVTKMCKAGLKDAVVGQRIDLEHPDVKKYFAKRDRAHADEQAQKVDPLFKEAAALAKKQGRCGVRFFEENLPIGRARAKKLKDLVEAAGYGKPPEKEPEPEPEPMPEPKEPNLRGWNARNEAKKQQAGVEPPIDPDVPENILEFADMTLRDVVYRYGTDTRFVDWLKALKAIEDIAEKRLKNSEKAGELVSRMIIKRNVIDVIDGAFNRMLSDGAKSIAAESVAMSLAGMTTQEVEEMVEKKLSSFIRPTKSKIARGLRDA